MEAPEHDPLQFDPQNQPKTQQQPIPVLQFPQTPSHAVDPDLQNPPPDNGGDELDDESSEQIIREELQNLVLRLTLIAENESEKDKVLEENWNWNENEKEEVLEENWNENWNGNGEYREQSFADKDWDDDRRSENGDERDDVGEGSFMDGVRRRRSNSQPQYPLRPDAEDCSFYMKTGLCKFGSNCKFNHPPRRRNQGASDKEKQRDENIERSGQIECKYYLTPGGCKYGKSCKYSHSGEKSSVAPIPELNFLGLPIRPGEKECPYYMRTGTCKYESNCRFHHPDPTTVAGDPSGQNNGGSFSPQRPSRSFMPSWSSPRSLNETPPFLPVIFSPTQGVPSPHAEWNGYQAPVYPTSELSLPTPPAFSMNIPASETNLYPHHQPSMLIEEFPERPGQPECSYFLKTGDCKYKSNCRFHHPKNRISKSASCILSDKGLPLRPDQAICSYYSRYGICKFGPACKYNHPENYSSSAAEDGSSFAVNDEGGSLIQQFV